MQSMMTRLLLLLFLTIIFHTNGVAQDQSGKQKLEIWEDAYHFFVIGDWGRNGFYRQKDVAVAMDSIGVYIEPECIISTGDNFYPNGIASIDDPYWLSSYENIYNGYHLFCPWYVVLGNHDYRGNVEAQIAYSQKSRRWNMPARYFNIDIPADENDYPNIQLLIIDTNPLQDDYYGRSKYAETVEGQDTTKQINWIKDQLGQSDAAWKLVFGHHPMYTSGKRKEDTSYSRWHLEDIFEENKVDAYFAGHEHDLQHQKPENKYTHHFVSGAGSEIRPTGKMDFTRFSQSIQGFMAVSVKTDQMLVQVIDYEGNMIYKTIITKTK